MMAPREWGEDRLAWAAYYAGRGMKAVEIAATLKVAATEAAVRKRLSRIGIPMRDAQKAAKGRVVVDHLTPATLKAMEAIAFDMDTTVEGLLWQIAEAIGGDEKPGVLVRNILDVDEQG